MLLQTNTRLQLRLWLKPLGRQTLLVMPEQDHNILSDFHRPAASGPPLLQLQRASNPDLANRNPNQPRIAVATGRLLSENRERQTHKHRKRPTVGKYQISIISTYFFKYRPQVPCTLQKQTRAFSVPI